MAIPDTQAAIAQFLCQLLEDPDPRIRAKAANALGKLGLDSTIPNLSQVVINDPDFQVRAIAIDALLLIAKPELLMTEPAKNQPIFNINQVGNINTGDVTIQGNQVGIQHNYAPEPSTEAPQQLAQLLTKLRAQYPNKPDTEIFAILLN